jgi:hypothetical protein
MMKNVDVDIYVNQLISFFDKNPNDLIDLIGDLLKESFYEKVREQCFKNIENGDEVSLTQKQIIDIVVELKRGHSLEDDFHKVKQVVQNTKFGLIFLN